jgi:hypothetical protein
VSFGHWLESVELKWLSFLGLFILFYFILFFLILFYFILFHSILFYLFYVPIYSFAENTHEFRKLLG